MGDQVEEKIEDKAGLSISDPESGSLPPDPGASYNVGTLPDVEQEARDQAVKDYEEAKKAVEEHEAKVIEQRAKAAGGEQEAVAPKAATKTSSSS